MVRMPSYRCYFLDVTHHITQVETSECADDDGAIQWAKSIVPRRSSCHSAELWNRADLIAGWRTGMN